MIFIFYQRPQYPEEDTHEEIVQDHSAELSLSKMEDEINVCIFC